MDGRATFKANLLPCGFHVGGPLSLWCCLICLFRLFFDLPKVFFNYLEQFLKDSRSRAQFSPRGYEPSCPPARTNWLAVLS
jgi:hypothetical protein